MEEWEQLDTNYNKAHRDGKPPSQEGRKPASNRTHPPIERNNQASNHIHPFACQPAHSLTHSLTQTYTHTHTHTHTHTDRQTNKETHHRHINTETHTEKENRTHYAYSIDRTKSTLTDEGEFSKVSLVTGLRYVPHTICIQKAVRVHDKTRE
jgi:hypothetical protein